MKTFLSIILLALTVSFTNAQDRTEKYNDYLERYEYYNDNGDLIGFKKYNDYLEQWEYTKINSSQNRRGNKYENIEYYQPDYELINNALKQKQKRYNSNEAYLQKSLNEIAKLLNQKYSGSENKEKAVNFFRKYSENLIDQLIPDGVKVDLSTTSNTNAIINTYIKALKKTFETIPVKREVTSNNRGLPSNNSKKYTDKGGKYFNEGNFSQAIKEFRKALIEDPNNYPANYYLAVSLLDEEKAIINEMNSLGLSKEDNERYNELDKDRKQLYREVLKYLEKAYELNPSNNEDVLKTIGNLYARLGQMEKFKEIQDKLNN
ncbi:hypothetical protein [Christiangramia sp. SM2212]|uniref:Tetratricopeptide repeat protein n=1 Tax=Christiangramia sediminicola TaxID=3073267 RepID=A0ABU1ERI0_9FLAO|nr:hypothetical protein [Christiangramia sp. SM2212]MDR5590803.1 hypothetical protein [Christiangramia sp. SM2212]